MAEVTVNVEVWCKCGSPLCHTVRDLPGAGNTAVGPCVSCIESAKDEVRDEGWAEANDLRLTVSAVRKLCTHDYNAVYDLRNDILNAIGGDDDG